MPSKDREQITYRPDIDGLRALAIISVIIFHAFPSLLPGGFVGVDVFFVISGYLITSIIYSDLHHEKFGLIGFYERRIRRLFPSLLVVLTVCALVGWKYLLPDELVALGKYLISTNLYVSNFLSLSETGYFDVESVRKPLLHTWSLSIEEQFYLFWPAILAVAYSRRIGMLGVCGVLLLLSFSLNIAETDLSVAFYSPLTRIWELLSGCFLALVLFNGRLGQYRFLLCSESNSSLSQNICSILGIALIGVSLFSSDKSSFPGWQAVLPVSGAFLVIAGKNGYFNRLLLSSNPAVFLGKISYPLYLWHWPFLSFACIFDRNPSVELRLLLVLASVILAVFTYYFVEKPLRKMSLFWISFCTLLISLVIIVFGAFVVSKEGYGDRLGGYKRALDQLKFPWMVQPECVSSHAFVKDGFCIQANPSVPPEAVIFGDSFAHAIANGLVNPYNNNLKLSPVLAVGRSGCMPYFGVEEVPNKGVHRDCQDMLRGLLDYILNTPSIKRVYLVGRHPVRVGNIEGFAHEPKNLDIHYEIVTRNGMMPASADDAFVFGLESTLSILTNAGKEVVFVHSVPELNFDPRDCLRFSLQHGGRDRNCAIKRSVVEQRQSRYRNLVNSILSKFKHATAFDPLDLFCDAYYCYPDVGGVMLYRDFNHVNADGGLYLLEHLMLANKQTKKGGDFVLTDNFFLTDSNWSHGVARRWAGFFVPNDDKFYDQYIVGRNVRFADGKSREIMGISQNGQYLNIFLDGDPLDPEKVGLPSKFVVMDDEGRDLREGNK